MGSRTRTCQIAGGSQAGVTSPDDDGIVNMRFSCPGALLRHIGFAFKSRHNSGVRRPGIAVAGLVAHGAARRSCCGSGGYGSVDTGREDEVGLPRCTEEVAKTD